MSIDGRRCTQVPIAIWAICQPLMQADRLHATHPLTHVMLCAAAGFFLHDAIACYLREPPMYILHGATCFVGYTAGALLSSLHFYGALFLMWELSTPFVQLRWALFKMGKSETLLYKVNGCAMVSTFFLARIAFGTCALPPLLLRRGLKQYRLPSFTHSTLCPKEAFELAKPLDLLIN
jgi:hypothetical protein